jgi:pimeloyl-ACP methyl ester carboxylesterase
MIATTTTMILFNFIISNNITLSNSMMQLMVISRGRYGSTYCHHQNGFTYRSFTSSSSKGTGSKKTSWRKQIHVSDDTPQPSTTLSGSISNTIPLSTTTTKNENKKLQFSDTPLGRDGLHLLDGLDHYTVYANDDGHPLSVYGIQSEMIGHTTTTESHTTTTTSIEQQIEHDNYHEHHQSQSSSPLPKKPILLLHGRTWSSVPVYHLLGGPFQQQQSMKIPPQIELDGDTASSSQQHESRSLMEALLKKGLQPYCMDFRGFGGTHMDTTQSVEPYRCVQDAETVLRWIHDKHSIASAYNKNNNNNNTNNSNGNSNSNNNQSSTTNVHVNDETAIPALLGWSQGALIAQLVAQRMHLHTNPPLLSKLILYGSIYDPLVRYPREPLYVSTNQTRKTIQENTYDAAIEDFTVEGTIPPEPARFFAEAALLSDPIKVIWKNLYQFNNCDPARVHVPCLVIAGDQDPYAPLHVQQELFCNLGRASDRTWSILSGSDHACHLLDGRDRLINTVVSFVMNGKRTEPTYLK